MASVRTEWQVADRSRELRGEFRDIFAVVSTTSKLELRVTLRTAVATGYQSGRDRRLPRSVVASTVSPVLIVGDRGQKAGRSDDNGVA
jgi:hypothetical protein